MFQIERDFQGPNMPCTIRFTETLYHRLNSAAVANNVSFNRLVLMCCRYALDHMETNAEPASPAEGVKK